MNASRRYDKPGQRIHIRSVPAGIRQWPLSIGHEYNAINRPRRTPRHSCAGSLYEYDVRRPEIAKTAPRLDTSTMLLTHKHLYDGWNLIAGVDGNNNNALVRSYVWGLDLSGSMQGAGGVGGLLMVKDATLLTHFVAYDLNGNVMGLVSAAYGTNTARYEYGPFGELIRATGPMAKLNPFRFSTKYQDDETDLIMYPYRPYSPSTGRFLCKDPIEEDGGANLYGCGGNDMVDFVDPLGLYTPIWLGTTVGIKNSGGVIGGHRLGATAVKASINSIKTSVKSCQCCLDGLDLKMELKGYAMAIGDKFKFGWPGGWEVTVDSDIQSHTIAHEQVHVNVAWNGFGKLFPKIESDCTGKCFSKPWLSTWTESSCRAKWESVIN